jgi:hypothetical protein
MRRVLGCLIISALPVSIIAVQGPQPLGLPDDRQAADATDINARGDIVGWLFQPSLPCPPNTVCFAGHSFFAPRGGAPILFDVPGAVATFAFGINAGGDIVGEYSDGSITHGFLRDRGGRFTTIDFPGEPFTVITGINAAGTMVGYYIHDIETEEASATGFVLDRGGFHVLPAPDVRPRAIAEDGTVVGSAFDFEQHPFIFRDGVFTRFDCPGAAFTELHDVLPDGTLLGVMLPGGTSPIEGFISSNGGCESLGAGVYAEGINAKGTIVSQLFGPAGGGPFVWQR